MQTRDQGLNVENIERLFLARLQRQARYTAAADATGVAPWRDLARLAVLSAYRDCAVLGLSDRATKIARGAGLRDTLVA